MQEDSIISSLSIFLQRKRESWLLNFANINMYVCICMYVFMYVCIRMRFVYIGMHNTCGDICIQRYMRFVYIGVCKIRVEIYVYRGI